MLADLVNKTVEISTLSQGFVKQRFILVGSDAVGIYVTSAQAPAAAPVAAGSAPVAPSPGQPQYPVIEVQRFIPFAQLQSLDALAAV